MLPSGAAAASITGVIRTLTLTPLSMKVILMNSPDNPVPAASLRLFLSSKAALERKNRVAHHAITLAQWLGLSWCTIDRLRDRL